MLNKLALLLAINGLLGIPESTYAERTDTSGRIYVVLLGGQSNAAGWGYHQYLLDISSPLVNPQTDVLIYSGAALPQFQDKLMHLQSGFGNPKLTSIKGAQQYPALVGTDAMLNHYEPELSLGRIVRDQIQEPQSKVAIIKYAIGGSNLYENWRADGTAETSNDGFFYQKFQTTVKKGIEVLHQEFPNDEIRIIGMAWVQGESDALQMKGENYQANLTTLIQDVRATFGANIAFALSKLSPNQVNGHKEEIVKQWDIIRTAQDATAASIPKVFATETAGISYGVATDFAEGPLHYLPPALLQIGTDLGIAIVE